VVHTNPNAANVLEYGNNVLRNLKGAFFGVEFGVFMHLESGPRAGYDVRLNWRWPIPGLAKTQRTRRKHGTFK
jgi:hypothetical protein